MDNRTTFLVCCAIKKTLDENKIDLYDKYHDKVIDACFAELTCWTAESKTWRNNYDPAMLKEITDAVCVLVLKGHWNDAHRRHQ